jgi:hypothetical protein
MRCPALRKGISQRGRPAFRTRLKIATDFAVRARAAGFVFRAVAADCGYGDQDGFHRDLSGAGLPFVMALKPHWGTWNCGPDTHAPVDVARDLDWDGPDDPGGWHPVTRTFRDGHTETWYAAEVTLGWWGPDGARRLVAATTGPGGLPDKAAPPPAFTRGIGRRQGSGQEIQVPGVNSSLVEPVAA